ncbi:putative gnat family protein [Fusarium austroafricanum]|uniref:Putative gnat family protein n=1 Tax=Fusarium austroafricanum TaxID=2364996 RepID=A0A8H4KH40_9HYPO|nr:putative gnat family protein [Fusarium austroafricanum]
MGEIRANFFWPTGERQVSANLALAILYNSVGLYCSLVSPTFASTYPQDVEKSYLREQQEALGDQTKLFTVVEIQIEAQNAQQVVGFAIWNYAQQQERKSETAAIVLADEKDRSVDPYRANILFSATESAVQKCLGGHMELDNMAVDPDHFRKGYGTLLCRHGMEIAREDKVPVGVIAAKFGMKLYEYLGYSCTAKVSLTDGRPGEDASVDFWVQKWNPKD